MLFLSGTHENYIAVYDEDDDSIEFVYRQAIVDAYDKGLEIYGMDTDVYNALLYGCTFSFRLHWFGITSKNIKRYVTVGVSKPDRFSDITKVSSVYDFCYIIKDYILSLYSNGWEYLLKYTPGTRPSISISSGYLDNISYFGYGVAEECIVFGYRYKYCLKDGRLIFPDKTSVEYGNECTKQNWLRKYLL